jgi:predicted dehydrogenase
LRKPILFEKPIGFTNYKIWKKIKYPKNKYIAFNRRFYKNVNYAKKLIKQKDLLNVEATVSENLIAFKKKFPFLNSKFIVFNTAIHVIDLLCYFFGDLRVINKIGNLNNTNSNLIIILQNKNKLTIYVNISFNLPENNSITIKTKKKEIFKFKPIENLRIYNKLKIYERKGQRRYISTFEKEINENYKYKPGFLLQMQNFIFQKKFCKIDQIEKTMKVLKKIIN